MLRRWIPMTAALALLTAGCPSGGGGSDMPPGPPQVQLSVERVFPALSFTTPVAMLQAPNDTSRWFVVEQGGVVKVFPNSPTVMATDVAEFVNISGQVTGIGEAGLLGMAFHPNFPIDPRVYLFYSHTDAGNLMSRLSEFRTADSGLTLAPGSEKILITLPKPDNANNHNGGNIAFGPDGFLYAGIGDGGGANDQHGPFGNAQNTSTLFGKMLRIEISATPGVYGIPPDNPFANNPTLCKTDGTSGSTAPCPEIFALGLRNPWRWSFDRATGQLWVGDVGQGAFEEVDRVDLGGNYGWRCFEGTRTNTGFPCGTPGETKLPVAQYGHDVGVSVTGGFVYRGTRFAGLVGRYIFADFGAPGRIFNIDATAQGVLEMGGGLLSGLSISSFGQGLDGELFAVDYNGGLYHIRQ